MSEKSLRALTVVALAVAGLLLSSPGRANNVGDEGCTPGYWKNHTDDWLEDDQGNPSYDTDERFSDVFGVDHGDVTLLEALQGGGGPGVAGARTILARAATAALLNAAHDGLGYPLKRWSPTSDGPAIIDGVQDVWNGDRDEILDLADLFDELNNLGCPLGGPAGVAAPRLAPAPLATTRQPATVPSTR